MVNESTCPVCGRYTPSGYCDCWRRREGSTCPVCGRYTPSGYCDCWRRNKEDVSFELWMVDEIKLNKHEHDSKSLLLTTKWEDVVALWCENLITIGKYKKACEEGIKDIIQNETMHDYILTRFENIDNCYSSLYLTGKLTKPQFEFYEKTQTRIVDKLNGDKLITTQTPVWEDFELFEKYLEYMLNSQFFEENEIRIENRSW